MDIIAFFGPFSMAEVAQIVVPDEFSFVCVGGGFPMEPLLQAL